jgi:hypothetical protein
MTTQAQKITFASDEFRDGVKLHLGLTGDDDVLQEQTDTITAIDLSGLHISDISDVVYLPKVKTLNLADNLVADLSPLTVLDSLVYLNLENNGLTDVNVLAFSSSRRMTVDVSLNYIKDFSYILGLTDCQFTLTGTQEQRQENPPYYKVHQLFVHVDEKGHLQVSYQGLTNMDTPVSLEGIPHSDAVLLDGNMHTMSGLSFPSETTMLKLTNGEQSDTTYVIPPLFYPAKRGTPIDIVTGLPDDYRIGLAIAKNGSTTIKGTTIEYTSGDVLMPDTVFISYYKEDDLKGYAQILTGLHVGDANADGKVTITDAVGIVNNILGNASDNFSERAADVNRDGNITITDAVGVVNIILSKGSGDD